MKRTVAILLALVLSAGCLLPALAVEEAPAEGSLYSQYGPWGEWTQEQKDAAEGWTDGQWDAYWEDYSEWAWLPVERYWEDYDAWEYAHYYGDDAQNDYWAEYIRQQKAEMGMPYPDGVNVSLNGTYLTLGGVQPLAVEGRTMVPVRAFLEELGAQVDYRDGVITAALEGVSLTLRLDSTELACARGEETAKIEMGVAPYVQEGRTYIPARFAAEALGMDVYWDDTYEAVHITDWEALRQELDSHFTCYNAILAAAVAAVDPDKTYAVSGSMSLAGTLYGERDNDTATLAVDVKGLQSRAGVSADIGLKVDLGDMEDTIFSALPEEALDLLDQLDGSKYSVILNAQEGIAYFKGDHLDELTGGALPGGAWISSGADEEMAAWLTGLLSGQGEVPTVGAILVEQQSYGYYYRQSPWEATMEMAAPWLLVLDDSNFTKTVSGGTTTYTAKLDMLTLGKRAAELGLLDDLTVMDLFTGDVQLPEVDLKITAQVQGEKLSSISCKGSVKANGGFPVEITVDVSGTPLEMEGEIAFKGAYVGKIEIKTSSSASVTTRAVTTAPPAGEFVVDYSELYGPWDVYVPEEPGEEPQP